MQISDCCFSAVALGAPYRKLAVELSKTLTTQAPGVKLFLATDAPQDFDGIKNIVAIPHRHRFGYRPYNDKLFALEAALQQYPIAIQTDVDSTFVSDIQPKLAVPWQPGVTGRSESLLSHTQNYNQGDLPHVQQLAQKLNVSLEQAQYVGEHMFVVRADGGKEKDFINCWKELAHYWDINKLGAKDGTLIGMSAGYVGWTVRDTYWRDLDQCLKHIDVHRQIKETNWHRSKRQWMYRLRILRSRLHALKNPDFFRYTGSKP